MNLMIVLNLIGVIRMRVFISYSRSDSLFCHELANNILKPFNVWFDQEIPGGVDWWEMILSQIDFCDVFIYLLSNESVNSKYCLDEYAEAVQLKKKILPILIRRNTSLPDSLKRINYVDMQGGFQDTNAVVKLFDSLITMERKLYRRPMINDVKQDSSKPKKSIIQVEKDFSYNYVRNFERTKLSERTKKAYFRQVCNFVEWLSGKTTNIKPHERINYLSSLSLKMLQDNLNERNVRLWLDSLHAKGVRNLSQSRAAISSLATLLAQDNYVDEIIAYQIQHIDIQGATTAGQDYRILTKQELEDLFSKLIGNHLRPLDVRNTLVFSLALVIRSGQINTLQWKQVKTHKGKECLFLEGENGLVNLPDLTINFLQEWRKTIDSISSKLTLPDCYIIGRSQGDVISCEGVTNGSIVNIVARTAARAGFDRVNPESLRLSYNQVRETIDPNFLNL